MLACSSAIIDIVEHRLRIACAYSVTQPSKLAKSTYNTVPQHVTFSQQGHMTCMHKPRKSATCHDYATLHTVGDSLEHAYRMDARGAVVRVPESTRELEFYNGNVGHA